MILQPERSTRMLVMDSSTKPNSRAPPWQTEYTSKLTRDPFSAQWTTKDEDCADVEESAEYSSAHWMVRLSG